MLVGTRSKIWGTAVKRVSRIESLSLYLVQIKGTPGVTLSLGFCGVAINEARDVQNWMLGDLIHTIVYHRLFRYCSLSF